jgi:CHAT domain-containing protein/tetratricopeptide (TPR) repeat protein
VLEVSREDDALKLSAHERSLGEENPVRHYERQEVSLSAMQHEVDTLMALLSRAAQHQDGSQTAVWQEIQVRGAALYQQLLSPGIQEALQRSTAADLFLYIDDALVQIPWELLCDGTAFLCRRFNMGRIVSTQQALVAAKPWLHGASLRMLIVANPTGDLEAATQEGRTIRDELTTSAPRWRVDIGSPQMHVPYLKDHMTQYDVLHYAGHADYHLQDPAQSGWRLTDGKLTAHDIVQIGHAAPMPALVFCNACESGQTTAWEIRPGVSEGIYGLANAFLLAGAHHYIGTFWEIPDQASAAFASYFYQRLADGVGVGEALRYARQELAMRYGETSIVWASYVLYGDPTFRYLEVPQAHPAPQPPVSEVLSAPPEAAAAPQGVLRGTPGTRPPRKLPLALGAAALAVLLALGAVWFRTRAPDRAQRAQTLSTQAYQALQQGDWAQAEPLFQQLRHHATPRLQSEGYAGLAAIALVRGEMPQALDWAAQADTLDPEIAYSYVIRGHVFFQQGKLEEARQAYQTATTKTHGAPWQQAIALDRLGRLSAAQGQTDLAMTYYDKAISQGGPELAIASTNKAYLLTQNGQYEAAVALYRQVVQQQPEDRLAAVLLREAERRDQLAHDQERQTRITQLIADLVQEHREGRSPGPQGDAWTSPPLTLALLDFQRQGTPEPRAGEDEVLLQSLAEALQASGRLLLIERDHLDALLTELQLGASALADPQVATRVGRILAARLLATGSIIRTGTEVQLSVRLIETETTRVRASATEVMTTPTAFETTVTSLAQTLLRKVRQVYPLQGQIVQVTPQGVLLNIGAEQGVTPGLVLQVFGSEEPILVDGKVVDYFREPVGQIKVTTVQPRLALAESLESIAPLQQEWKVQEVEAKTP